MRMAVPAETPFRPCGHGRDDLAETVCAGAGRAASGGLAGLMRSSNRLATPQPLGRERMSDALIAETITIAGHDGDEIEAYLARPLGRDSFGGVVVIHHMPGYDGGTKEITRKFAAHGYAALMPNLYHRDAPGADPDDAAAAARAKGGVPDERLVGDVAGAAAHLRGRDGSNGKVGVIGYCSGGPQSFLAACSLPLEAAVDCYGAFVGGTPPAGMRREAANDGWQKIWNFFGRYLAG